jgi:two-component system, LuxR family, sensor kinase FixL
MTSIDLFLAYAESRRAVVCVVSSIAIVMIAWADWLWPIDTSVGFLYLLPVLLSAAALNSSQILALAVACGYLREVFDPIQGALPGWRGVQAFNPVTWVPGSGGRLVAATAGFAMTGFFVTQLNQRRRLLAEHLKEQERQILRRQETEMEVRMLIETSPLAILTLDHEGRILLVNQSVRKLLACESEPLEGEEVVPYLPILARLLHSQHSSANIRTNLECRGQRRNGEVFLANVWVSTYRTSAGPGLVAVVWDASENLRDRERTELDSMLSTSRVVIGAISHEIRNLASAASATHAGLAPPPNAARSREYEVLGSLIAALERIASSGLRMASQRETAVADLGTILDEARIVIEPMLREAGFELTWNVQENLPPVQSDQHSLLQVFVNLARNSAEHAAGGAERKVSISTGMEKDLVVVRFQDSGPGVAHPEELFQPFQMGAQSSGLGLYISRAILRSQGGNLRYEPSAQGACFAVELWPMENGAAQ